jgi:hypothetical protein
MKINDVEVANANPCGMKMWRSRWFLFVFLVLALPNLHARRFSVDELKAGVGLESEEEANDCCDTICGDIIECAIEMAHTFRFVIEYTLESGCRKDKVQ